MGSSQDLVSVTAWLSTCQTQHRHCVAFSSQDNNSFFPTRVLDVADAALGTVYLRDRADVVAKSSSGYPPYWTLSHRWGNNTKILQLRKESEGGFRDGILTQNLSPVFRDAVLLVQRLGYQYIWIDSLCIFQDLLADWQAEAAVMVDVYRNSLCNISAVAASYEPSCVGLFDKRRLPPRMLFPFVADMEICVDGNSGEGKMVSGKWMVYCQSPWDDEIESAPISTRGWVVQERFLAPRVLHFTRNQIYWECLEASHAATHPKTNLSFLAYDTSFRSGYKATGLELSKARAASESDPLRRLYHIHWGTIVSNYVRCLLTKESDRLLAMSGIAKVFQEVNRDVYLAGLWRKTVHADLGWTTEASSAVPAHRSTDLRAPSWSWASIVGGNVKLYLRTLRNDLPFPTIKLVDARIVPEGEDGDTMGLLKSAELEIDCVLHHYLWRGEAKSLTVFEMGSTTVSTNMTLQLALDTSDVVEKFDNAEEIRGVCVPINGSYIKYGGGENKFLVLEHESGQRYRRLGLITGSRIGSFLEEDHLHRMDTTRITLI